MSTIDSLIAEFDHEAQTTRKYLERLPEDKQDWQPHAKSFTAIGLAGHITEMMGWAEIILKEDWMDFDPVTYKPYQPASLAELLRTFDDNVARTKKAFAAATDDTLGQLWSFRIMGEPHFERPRAAVLRDVAFSHVIHHRGQFSVYLRLLEIPVPGAYGPSADEE